MKAKGICYEILLFSRFYIDCAYLKSSLSSPCGVMPD